MTMGTHMRLEFSQGLGLQSLADLVKEVRCEGLQHPMRPQHTAQSTYTQRHSSPQKCQAKAWQAHAAAHNLITGNSAMLLFQDTYKLMATEQNV